jgi:hypothetical protein
LGDRLQACLLRQEVEDIGDDFFLESPLTSCATTPASSPKAKPAELVPDLYSHEDPHAIKAGAEPCESKRRRCETEEIDSLNLGQRTAGMDRSFELP